MIWKYLIILFICSQAALASEAVDEYGVLWCVDHKASSDEKQLRCLNSMDVSKAVRKAFTDIIQKKKVCPRCEGDVIGEEKVLSLLHIPFIVVEIDLGGQGGYEVYFVFKRRPDQEFVAQMNYVDKGMYNLSLISDMNHSKKTLNLVKKLSRKAYRQYWL